ncbi:hypothetical protein KUTeg_016501 [Tegillarca granosa]|uniref:Major facilitator superfamily (MFS) profile domain-containing protein n=1 Tax=Tegillarca granosa TaxID=220873 RepID=A0ABQ9ENJ7_TEGGR|nr:hypothetical protein KUTeg_016501 [Tegillarca granosa]
MQNESIGEGEILLKKYASKHLSDSDSEDGSLLQFTQIELEEQHLTQPVVNEHSLSSKNSSVWGSCYVVMASIMASLGGILFGYDIGFFIDSYGRRLTIIINAVVFVIGAAILGLSPNYTLLLIGRLIVGFAVSISATGECIYISEIAPAKKRGLLVSLNELGITLGLLLAYLVNFLFIQLNNGWLAKEVLQKLRGTQNVDTELVNIRISISTEKNHSCIELFSKLDNMRGRMLIGAGLVFFQQFTGQPSVLYYAPTIFEAIGFETNSAATLATVGLGIVKTVTWLVLSEIFPAAVKGRAIAFTTVLNWGTNLVISLTFLNVIDGVGVSMTFIVFSVLCIISVMFIFIYVPETKGRSLEQISVDLKKRSPLAVTAVKCTKLCSCCPTNKSRVKVTSVYSKVKEEASCESVG